ncbi:hypothetical protein KUCAC02_009505, partial [Chaenocephalus aceratus]
FCKYHPKRNNIPGTLWMRKKDFPKGFETALPLAEHLDWLKEQGSPQRLLLPPVQSRQWSARLEARAHTVHTYLAARVKGATERVDSPEDFDFVCG